MTTTISKVVDQEVQDVTLHFGTGSREVVIMNIAFKDGEDITFYFQSPALAKNFAEIINRTVNTGLGG